MEAVSCNYNTGTSTF